MKAETNRAKEDTGDAVEPTALAAALGKGLRGNPDDARRRVDGGAAGGARGGRPMSDSPRPKARTIAIARDLASPRSRWALSTISPSRTRKLNACGARFEIGELADRAEAPTLGRSRAARFAGGGV